MLNFFRDEPYSLPEIRQTLDEASARNTSFFQLLEKHHDFLEESLPVLMDKIAPIDEKQKHLTRFLHLWNMHAKAEEETLYQGLLDASALDAHLEGMWGQDEHLIARQLANELQELNYESNWSEEADAKAKVLASLVESHIEEEERNLFLTAKRDIDAQVLKNLKAEYLEKCKHYLDLELHPPYAGLNDKMIEKGL